MKNETERLPFNEAYDAAQQENIAMIHEAAIAENERVESSRIGGEKI